MRDQYKLNDRLISVFFFYINRKVFEEMNQEAKDKLNVSEQELERELKRYNCDKVVINIKIQTTVGAVV